MSTPAEQWRIGTLASRVGVSETLLRAWEMRYGLLSPERTAGGYRLYGPDDERRARAMQQARERGVPASQAAAEILSNERGRGPEGEPRGLADAPGNARGEGLDTARALEELAAAMTAYDVRSMHEVIDRALSALGVESTIRDVLLPFMAAVGRGWEQGDFDVADEHFASDLVRGRLAALAAGAGARTGPLALLCCPPEESHDLALKAFEVVLQRAGWRTRFLGPMTPVRSIVAAADVMEPRLVVVAATTPHSLALEPEDRDLLRTLTARFTTVIAGAGASAPVADDLGARLLLDDPVVAARRLLEWGLAREPAQDTRKDEMVVD